MTVTVKAVLVVTQMAIANAVLRDEPVETTIRKSWCSERILCHRGLWLWRYDYGNVEMYPKTRILVGG